MRKQFNIVVFSSSEDEVRKNVTEWFSQLQNLNVDSVIPYRYGGYQVQLSYDAETIS